jgi:hypothetical protein
MAVAYKKHDQVTDRLSILVLVTQKDRLAYCPRVIEASATLRPEFKRYQRSRTHRCLAVQARFRR